MKTTTLAALALAAAVLPLAAQTPASKPATPTAQRTATTSGCAKHPELSSKIPALPAGTACPKVLYTVTKLSDTKLDYASPLVSPELKATLGGGPSTYSLDYVDTKIGTGDLAKPGKYYTVHYTGYLLTDGTKFDSSVDRGDPISFPYGGHRVIPGWDTGFEGMRTGGKRRLFIPYQLAYGEAGHPPVIPAKSMLVFDVEFISQSDTQPPPKPRAPVAPVKPKPVVPPPAPDKIAPPPPPAQPSVGGVIHPEAATPPPPPPPTSSAPPAPKPDESHPKTVGGVIHPQTTTPVPAPASTTTPPPQNR